MLLAGLSPWCSHENNANVLRFEVFTAVTTKNIVFWNIKTQFVPHYFSTTESSQLMLCKI
jgi:hypothetical protein